MHIGTDTLSLAEQNSILSHCLANGIPLSECLEEKGLSYDNLRYLEYKPNLIDNSSYTTLDDMRMQNDAIPAVSFFAGAGGLDIGFEYAGFNNLASIEFSDVFCDTLRANFTKSMIVGPPKFAGDIRDREAIVDILENEMGVKTRFDGVFHGGPPCQSFSIAANQRFSKEDENFKRQGFADSERGGLIFDFLWLIRYFQPRAFLIENVAGIQDCDDKNKMTNELAALSKLGYYVESPKLVNTAYYGVPQNRIRWLMIGVRGASPVAFPEENDDVIPCNAVFEKPMGAVNNHLTRKHSAESIKRYMLLGYGGRDKLGRVDRLNPYQPSKTVIAGGTKGGGRSHLHPNIPRTLSVRECARLQTFPDSYVFTGPTARQFTQVGNAVPPLFAYKIALSIKAAIAKHQ